MMDVQIREFLPVDSVTSDLHVVASVLYVEPSDRMVAISVNGPFVLVSDTSEYHMTYILKSAELVRYMLWEARVTCTINFIL